MSPPYTANLLRLDIEQTERNYTVLRPVAHTLTDLSLNCTGSVKRFDLPRLPHLAALELKLTGGWPHFFPPWLPDVLAQLPPTLPALQTLTLHSVIPDFYMYPHITPEYRETNGLDSPTLAAIDNALGGTGLQCVFDLAFAETHAYVEKPCCLQIFESCRALLELNLVRLREERALEVRYSQLRRYEEGLL